MKACSAFIAVVLMACLIGCGADEETAASAGGSSKDRTAAETTRAEKEPDYPLPSTPPQKGPLTKLVVKDIEVGAGPVARWGDEATVRYVGVYAKNGEVFTQHWNFPYSFELDGETIGPGWQKGIQGMRVGGRRELLIPGALIFEGGTDAIYVVTLDKVKSGTKD